MSFGTVKGLLLFVCIHNIGKLSAGFEQERFNDESKLGNSKLAQRHGRNHHILWGGRVPPNVGKIPICPPQ